MEKIKQKKDEKIGGRLYDINVTLKSELIHVMSDIEFLLNQQFGGIELTEEESDYRYHRQMLAEMDEIKRN